jgi:hypothetical protein
LNRVRCLPPTAAGHFLEAFVRSYEKEAIILTTKWTSEDRGQLEGDAATGAMMDRFLHHAEVVRFSSMEETTARNMAKSSEPKPRNYVGRTHKLG